MNFAVSTSLILSHRGMFASWSLSTYNACSINCNSRSERVSVKVETGGRLICVVWIFMLKLVVRDDFTCHFARHFTRGFTTEPGGPSCAVRLVAFLFAEAVAISTPSAELEQLQYLHRMQTQGRPCAELWRIETRWLEGRLQNCPTADIHPFS